MTTKPPIGISGFAQSGKTTAAEYLQREHGYTRLHIADPLRRMLDSLLRDFGIGTALRLRYLEGDLKEMVIPQLGVTSRSAQITLGTEWGRQLINADLWANCWQARAAAYDAPMNDSVRFPNEEQVIRDMQGFTILIVRDGARPAAFKNRFSRWLYDTFGVMRGVHDSERVDRLNPDFVIYNNGSLEDLYRALDEVVGLYREYCDMGIGDAFRPIAVRGVSP